MILSGASVTLTSPQWFSIYLKEDLGAHDENIGFLNAVQNGVSLLSQPVGGAIGQRFSKKNLYLVSLAIQALAFLIAFLAQDWTWTILMSVVLGLGALMSPGISALIGEITDRATRATVFALQATVTSLVIMVRGPLQGFLAESMGLRPLYLVGVIGVVSSFLIFLKFFPEVSQQKNKQENLKTEKKSAGSAGDWKEQVRQVFARRDYRRNFIGLIQAGILWRLFVLGFYPFVDIYLYKDIGWSLLFFGFYARLSGFLSSFLTAILKIPFGKIIDKYHLRRIFYFAGPFAEGIMFLLMVFARDPYHLAAIFLIDTIIEEAHVLSVSALWYDAIPLEVYSIGSAVRGVLYQFSATIGSLLGAYLWATLGSASSFCIAGTAQITAASVALYLIREIKDEK